MTRPLSLLIAWGCKVLLAAIPAAALYFLMDPAAFQAMLKSAVQLPIQWHTVTAWQQYVLWVLTVLYISIGLAGLYFLSRAFANFARGELFNLANSRDLRRFSVLVLIQAVVAPLHFALVSLLLSLNHPAGEKVLAVMVSSKELMAIGVGVVLWVMSNLLVEGSKLQAENQQFV